MPRTINNYLKSGTKFNDYYRFKTSITDLKLKIRKYLNRGFKAQVSSVTFPIH